MRRDCLVERIGFGLGVVERGVSAYDTISGVCGQTIWLILLFKMPSMSFVRDEMGAVTIGIGFQTNHFGNKVWVDIFFFAA